MKIIVSTVFVALAVIAPCLATSITYNGGFATTLGPVSYSITTDGTIGVIQNNNILSVTATLTEGGVSTTNSLSVGGTSDLTATATDLYFDFGDDVNYTNTVFSGNGTGLVAQLVFWDEAEALPGFGYEQIRTNPSGVGYLTDVPAQLTSIGSAATPEPASVALSLGAGLMLGMAGLWRKRKGQDKEAEAAGSLSAR